MSDLAAAIAQERRKLAKVLHEALAQDLKSLSALAESHADNLLKDSQPADEARRLHAGIEKPSNKFHAVYAALEPATGPEVSRSSKILSSAE